MPNPESQAALANWQEEKRSAYLYQIIAQTETNPVHQKLFAELALACETQAKMWQQLLHTNNEYVLQLYQPDLRAKFIGKLIHHFGAQKIKPILAAIKVRGLSVFNAGSQQNAANTLSLGFHSTPSNIDQVGARHKGAGNSGGLRAAVFGVNDGLISIACLMMGVAGANSSDSIILTTGLAGLLAGAFSMAAGEYISMRSQREMFEYQINLERAELAQYPEQEASELTLIYMARGMQQTEASTLAKRLIANPQLALDVLAREELGLNPDDLGSPWLAAISSFFAFAAGGLLPILPYTLPFNLAKLYVSLGLTAFALFAIGAALSLFTGRNAIRGGVRMLLIGGGAGILTYYIGQWLGANIS